MTRERQVVVSFGDHEKIVEAIENLRQQAQRGEEPEMYVAPYSSGQPPLRLRFVNEDEPEFDEPLYEIDS